MRRSNWNIFYLKSTPSSSCFQALDLFPSFGMLRIKQKSSFASNFNRARINCFSELVSCFAHVSTTVFLVGIQNIKCNKTEIISSFEAMASLNGFSVHEPFNFKIW